MTRMRSCWVLLLGLGLMVGATARADAPAFLPIQGTLTDASGNPVEGPVDLRLEIFGSETGGTALWWETQTVDAVDGMVSAYAGSAVPLALELFRDNGVLYLQITVGTSAALPRMQLATTPYAAFAQFADDAGSVGGTTLTGLATSGHNHDDRYFTESELANSGAGGSVHWNNVTNVPAGFADGTDDTGSSYTAGAGITITGTTLAVSQTTIEGWARGVCYDTSAELRGVLDSVYSPLGHAHAWSTITGMPAGFADGTDDGTTYIAGSGLTLTGSTFSVNTTALRSVFDLVYSLLGHAHAWSTITGMPAGFADGTDDGTTYIAGSGLTLTGSTFSVNTAAIQARVTGTCAAGSSIRVIDAAGGVTCETDDTGSGGSYTAGAGINITGTTISVATGGVTSAMILDGTIASADHVADSIGMRELNPISGMAYAMSSLVTGTYYYYVGTAFVPPVSGSCLVTATVEFNTGAANTSSGPFFRIAIKRGSTDTEDGLYGHYPGAMAASEYEDMSRSSVVAVNAGESTQFGCYLGFFSTDWTGDSIDCHVTWLCF